MIFVAFVLRIGALTSPLPKFFFPGTKTGVGSRRSAVQTLHAADFSLPGHISKEWPRQRQRGGLSVCLSLCPTSVCRFFMALPHNSCPGIFVNGLWRTDFLVICPGTQTAVLRRTDFSAYHAWYISTYDVRAPADK